MKPAADYFTATLPEPWQILGLRLRPFSLGHYKLLRRFDCAFVSDTERNATLADLTLGVLCCSKTPRDFLAFIELPTFADDCKEWGKSIGVFDVPAKAKMFFDYIEAHSVVPKYWEEEKTGVSGAHWAQCLEVTLRGKLGWTGAEIDSEPLSKAFADYFKHAENEGSIKLMTPEEIALIEGGQSCVA